MNTAAQGLLGHDAPALLAAQCYCAIMMGLHTYFSYTMIGRYTLRVQAFAVASSMNTAAQCFCWVMMHQHAQLPNVSIES